VARYPAFTATHWHDIVASLAANEYLAIRAVALWVWLAWANSRGREWARLVFGAFFVLATLGLLDVLSEGAAIYAPADFTAGVVNWLIAAAAAAPLFTSQACAYYRPEPAGR
jgi:heme A synthase